MNSSKAGGRPTQRPRCSARRARRDPPRARRLRDRRAVRPGDGPRKRTRSSGPHSISASRYLDTAPLYGLGASERRVGEALAGRPRNTFTLSTKVGRLLREHAVAPEKLPDGMWHVREGLRPVLDFGRDATRRALMESLERSGLERVDIAYVARPGRSP